jgi:hypothetical protein
METAGLSGFGTIPTSGLSVPLGYDRSDLKADIDSLPAAIAGQDLR